VCIFNDWHLIVFITAKYKYFDLAFWFQINFNQEEFDEYRKDIYYILGEALFVVLIQLATSRLRKKWIAGHRQVPTAL
jgi:hypothetical protein